MSLGNTMMVVAQIWRSIQDGRTEESPYIRLNPPMPIRQENSGRRRAFALPGLKIEGMLIRTQLQNKA